MGVEEGSKMKFIAAACLVAAAFAEPEAKADADAALLYGAHGYGGYASPYALGYSGYAASPYTYGHAAYAGYPYAAGYAGAHGAFPYAGAYGAHYIGKRSADAEPKADAFYGAYGYSAYGASPYAYSGHRAYGGYPYSYGAYPAYGAYSHYG